MRIRVATPADLVHPSPLRSLVATPSINTTTLDVLDRNLALGTYRPEWIWLAEDCEPAATDGHLRLVGADEAAAGSPAAPGSPAASGSPRLLGAAVWWGFAGGDHPLALDGLVACPFVDDATDLWTRLLEASLEGRPHEAESPEYHVFLPPDWREDPELITALEPRLAAAARVGLTELTERLRYEWSADQPVPQASSRLTFAPEPDDEAFVDLFVRVAHGSLDAATAREAARRGMEEAAREDVEVYRSMAGERAWWRVARDTSGEVVGFALPSANDGGPVVGYLGVLPEHRGRGYVDDLLGEITRALAATGAERIRADTDLGNRPMAAAFERAGYRRFAERLVASVPGA